jgi:hypothetical protein
MSANRQHTIELFVLRRRITALKVAAVPADDFEARRVAVTSLVGQMISANETATRAGLSPHLTLELFAVAALGFFPETDGAIALSGFNHTTRYLYQLCDRTLLGETPYALLRLHAADFGERVRLAFPDLDFGTALLDDAEVAMSPLDDLVFQYPIYSLAILPHLCDFVAPGLCSDWTSLSSNLASRAWSLPGTHALDWAQQISNYCNMTLVTLSTPTANAARGQATLAAGLSPRMTTEELSAWMLAASLPQTTPLQATLGRLPSIIVDPHAATAADTATGEQTPTAGEYTHHILPHPLLGPDLSRQSQCRTNRYYMNCTV